MSAIEVVVRPRPQAPPSTALAPLHGRFDVIVDGVNITARLGESQALSVLSDLGHAVSALSRGKRDRATLPLYAADQAWELGLEADGSDVLVSVYRTGPAPEVAVHERRVDLIALRAALVRAIDEARTGDPSAAALGGLAAARRLLEAPWPSYGRRPIERVSAQVAPKPAGGLTFGAQAAFRASGESDFASGSPHVERADLHALLVRGSVTASARGRTLRVDDVSPFLVAERLVALAEEVLEAWRAERALVRRLNIDGAWLGVQRGPGDGPLTLTFSARGSSRDEGGIALAGLKPPSVVKAIARFARGLYEKFVELDRSQSKNLRLVELGRGRRHRRRFAHEPGAGELSLLRLAPLSHRARALGAQRQDALLAALGRDCAWHRPARDVSLRRSHRRWKPA